MEKSLKQTLSAPFFRSTRITSCQYVVTRNGQTRAVSFPYEKTGWKAPNSWNNQRRSTEVASTSNTAHRVGSNCHAGMAKKPLTAYNPSCFRSRLPSADVVMPYKNASVVEIGDRSSYNPRSTFRTTYKASMQVYNPNDFVSNPGIASAKVKWTHLRTAD